MHSSPTPLKPPLFEKDIINWGKAFIIKLKTFIYKNNYFLLKILKFCGQNNRIRSKTDIRFLSVKTCSKSPRPVKSGNTDEINNKKFVMVL